MWAFIWFAAVGISWALDVEVIDYNVTTAVTWKTPNVTNIGELYSKSTKRNAETTNSFIVTDYGWVRGQIDNNRIVRFYDIPYGNFSEENPFQEPFAPHPWGNDVLVKTEHKSRCPQIDSENKYVGNRDCLTLSIFTPEKAFNADVLFHIHDNSNNIGSGDHSKYGPKYLADRGVILVLPNYRIGSLGFLCLQNETAPGNAGLKDLHLALQWTKKNIKAFGGNDSNIVISGSGVAGALVEYLILSNNSRPLISKAITESGFALSPWALDRYPLETARNLIKELEKSTNNAETENFNRIFNEVNLEDLVKASQNLTFLPCIGNENGFLTQSPWHLLNHEELDITVMSGSANHAAMDKALAHTEETLSEINQDFSLLLPDDLKFNSVDEKNRLGRQVKTQYFGDNNVTTNDLQKLSQCYTDSQYFYPGIRGARLLIKRGAKVYFYEFSYKRHDVVNGSASGDSLNYIFSKEDIPEDATETSMKTIMLNLWTTFIKIGKPSALNIEWTDLKADKDTEEAWLSIGDKVLAKKGFHHTRLKLWDDIYKNHFVERSLALKLNPSIYITLLMSIFLLDISYDYKF